MRFLHVSVIAVVALGLVAPLQANMAQMAQMGGSSFIINVVSPMTATTQIRRGILMINRRMTQMQPMMTPGAGPGSQSPGLQIRLLLVGVADQDGLVTGGGNHLYVSGSLTAPGAQAQPIAVDQTFGITAGTGAAVVPVGTSGLPTPAVLQIENIEITDAAGKTFGVPGLRLAAPVSLPTQSATPGMPHSTMTPGMGPGPTMTPHMGPGTGMGPGMGGP